MQQMIRFGVRLVDEAYYRDVVSCQAACPVHTDACNYVNAVASGDFKEGYLIARQPNPFASVCGRVCNAPCETACRRRHIDNRPITIRALKRYLCEYHGVESSDYTDIGNVLKNYIVDGRDEAADLGNSFTAESMSAMLQLQKKRRAPSGQGKVAVVGAGPAGLTAAHDLAVMGYEVTIFEAAPAPGGMLLLGIPEYRLPRDVLKREIKDIQKRGVEIKLNTRLGRDFTLSSLKKDGYGAIFIASGAHRDARIGLEGEDLEGVISGIDFLRKINIGQTIDIGRRVAVIGGGNVAMDAVRTALRLGEDEILTLDTVRTASRLGAKEAFILYRRSREEMPASEIEIEEAIEEGIKIHYQVAPRRILGENGKVTAVECVRMALGEPDDSGRRSPVPIEGSEFVLGIDTVISAIGQISDLSFITPEDNISLTSAGTIAVDEATLATTQPGVFAGGDVAFGPRIIIEAVRDGHKAARAIDRFYQGEKKTTVESRYVMEEITHEKLPAVKWLSIRQKPALALPVQNRKGFQEVEQVFGEAAAFTQASRCLQCNIQTVFDSDKCILCGGCVDVCPRSCYSIIPLDKLEGEESVANVVEARYGIPLETFRKGGDVLEQGAAIIKDEDNCVRCGLCAERCPTEAITMETFTFSERIVPENSGTPVETRG